LKEEVQMKTLILGLAAAASIAAALPAAAQPVDAREHNQAERIQQGERSGALTPNEARALHRKEFRVRRFEAVARARHGGYLTRHDRKVLARMQNRDSHAIYRLKHNARRD
jgi:hypothetical protein